MPRIIGGKSASTEPKKAPRFRGAFLMYSFYVFGIDLGAVLFFSFSFFALTTFFFGNFFTFIFFRRGIIRSIIGSLTTANHECGQGSHSKRRSRIFRVFL